MVEKPAIRIGHPRAVDLLAAGLASFGTSPWVSELEHLFLESVAMNSWNQVLEGLCNKKIDGAFIPVPAAINLVAAGTKIKFLLLGPKAPTRLIKSRAAKIKTFADFAGHTIFVPHGLSIHTILLHRLMASVGLSFGTDNSFDVVFEVMPFPMMIEALEHDLEGRIGGFIAPAPFGNIAVAAGTGEVFCESETLWPGYPWSVFVLNSVLVEAYPDAVSELVQVLLQGQADILPSLKTFEIIHDYMKKNLGLDDCETDLAECLDMRFAGKKEVAG